MVKEGLRKKYFRTPTLNEVQVKFNDWEDAYSITISIGKYSKCRYFRYDIPDRYKGESIDEYAERKVERTINKSNLEERKTICNNFCKNKTKENLEKICRLVNVQYDNLMKPSYQKMLLNEEGIEFTKEILNRLVEARDKLLSVVDEMQILQAEISVLSPNSKSIYKKDNNRHIDDLNYEISKLEGILYENGV